MSFAYRTDESRGIIHNIMSTKGALLSILGEVDKAMGVLNEVLRSDPNHYLALMRRSQAYKKVLVLTFRKGNLTARSRIWKLLLPIAPIIFRSQP